MTGDDKEMTGDAPVCRQVFERAVGSQAGADEVMADATLAAHVGSCVTCFRTLGELRDVPRLAAALRDDAPAVVVPDRFWDDLAARTTGAAAAALASGARRRRLLRVSGFASTFAAAAAALLLMVGRGHVGPEGGGPGTPSRPFATGVGSPSPSPSPSIDDEAAGEGADVADLDESALRRLLDRLRAQAPAHAAALAAGGDAQDAADIALDDEGVSDALADLDAPALRRVERSLSGASL